MAFSEIYFAMIPIMVIICGILALSGLGLVWAVWADAELKDEPLKTPSTNQNIDICDMLFITLMLTLAGLVGTLIASIAWPITLPIMLVISGVYGTKFFRAVKEKRREKKNMSNEDKLVRAMRELKKK